MAVNPLHTHLRSKGPMTRKNPELLRLARKTGYSVEHIYHVALGRSTSRACAVALAGAVRDAAVTVESLAP